MSIKNAAPERVRHFFVSFIMKLSRV